MRRNAGFTLLEILLALFIFSIIALIITNALHTVFTSQESTEKKATRMAELQIAMTYLANDFEQIVNRPKENPFIGLKNSVTFTHAGVTNPLGQATRSTLQRATYRYEEGKLIRETWATLDAPASQRPNQRTLLTHVTDLYFQYLDKDNHFQNRWPPEEQPSAMPRAIQIFLTLSDLGKISQIYMINAQVPEQSQSTPKPPEPPHDELK